MKLGLNLAENISSNAYLEVDQHDKCMSIIMPEEVDNKRVWIKFSVQDFYMSFATDTYLETALKENRLYVIGYMPKSGVDYKNLKKLWAEIFQQLSEELK